MNEVKLDILNKQGTYIGTLDIADDNNFPLAISQSVTDIKDISKRSGVVSKTFKVPATAANNQVLRYIYNANVDANTTVWGNRGVVIVNGLPVVKGLIRILNVYQENSPLEYEIELAGENLDWALQLKDVSIRDLDYGNPQVNHFELTIREPLYNLPIYVDVPASTDTHFFNEETIEASWKGSYDTGWDYVYSLKNYGEREDPKVVSVKEMRPDVYVLSILKKSFEKVGYSLDGNFVYSSYFKHLVMLFTGSNFTFQSPADGNFKLGTVLQVMADPHPLVIKKGKMPFWAFNGYGEYINSGITYDGASRTFTSHGYFTGTLTLHIEHASNNYFLEPVGLQLYKNGAAYYTLSQPDLSYDTVVEDFTFAPNDVFYVEYSVFPGLGPLNLPLWVDVLFTSFLSFEAYADPVPIPEKFPYRLGSVLPDMKCIDFISGLANMFNLYFKTDEDNKVVTCETRDGFYKDSTHAKDWSGKLDIEKQAQTNFLNNYNRTLQFCFNEDGNDSLIKTQEMETGKRAGSLDFDLPERYNSGTQQLGTKEFSFTRLAEDMGLKRNNPTVAPVIPPVVINNANIGGAPIIPTLWNGDDDPAEVSYDFAPRILYYQGYQQQLDHDNIYRHWYWVTDSNDLYKVPYADYGPSNDVQLRYDGDNGLVKSFYANDIAQLNEGKIIIAWFYLHPTDIMKLDLSYPIYIDHHSLKGYYYINKLYDYQPNKDISTKVELIRATTITTPVIDYSQGVNYSNARLGTGISRGVGSATTLLQSGVQLPSVPIHSSVLHNGSNNLAVRDAGSVAIGVGLQAPGVMQHVYGNYNIASTNDLFQVGGGSSESDRYRALTFTRSGDFLVQGGYLYTTDGQEILFGSQRNAAGQITRFDKLHLQGNQ